MEIESCQASLNAMLASLKLKAQARACRSEGAFMVCDISLLPGGTVAGIERRATEIGLGLKAKAAPLVYPVPPEGVVRMEIPFRDPDVAKFSEIASSPEFLRGGYTVPLALGRTRLGKPLVADLAKMPHLLVAGTTGSGKSMILHAIIQSVRKQVTGRKILLALVDPKQVEFSQYSGSPLLWSGIGRDPPSAEDLLRSLASEMEERFSKMRKAGVQDISAKPKIPRIVLVIDELADLMMASKKTTQTLICRLAQKSRACGIHIVAVTQRPSVDVVTGAIKANFPARISCQVSSATDSRVVLDKNGAEKLLGAGDAILDAPGYPFIRFRGAFLPPEERVGGGGFLRRFFGGHK